MVKLSDGNYVNIQFIIGNNPHLIDDIEGVGVLLPYNNIMWYNFNGTVSVTDMECNNVPIISIDYQDMKALNQLINR